MMRYKYVVIEREYGSGGTEIGKLLSEKTGIPCYGSEIQREVSEKMNIPVSEIEKYEESATNSLLYSLYAISRMNTDTENILSREDRIFVEQQRLIKDIAMRGRAIFVGRCAGAALDSGSSLSVFIHADSRFRIERAIEEYGIDKDKAPYIMAKFDKKRRSYYFANTGKRWTDRENYHIILDSGKLGLEGCAEAIAAVL